MVERRVVAVDAVGAPHVLPPRAVVRAHATRAVSPVDALALHHPLDAALPAPAEVARAARRAASRARRRRRDRAPRPPTGSRGRGTSSISPLSRRSSSSTRSTGRPVAVLASATRARFETSRSTPRRGRVVDRGDGLLRETRPLGDRRRNRAIEELHTEPLGDPRTDRRFLRRRGGQPSSPREENRRGLSSWTSRRETSHHSRSFPAVAMMADA